MRDEGSVMIENPLENSLPKEAVEGYLLEAVRRSGYPLQSIVAAELAKSFAVTEEWGYADRTTQEQRNLDIFAFKRLAEENRNGLLVAPSVVMLVECKRSSHPFVFFESETEQSRSLSGFPTIVGVQRVELRQGVRSKEVAPSQCLGLESEPFAIGGPPICTTFARAGGKGDDSGLKSPQNKGVVLTGSDAYNSILLPLGRVHTNKTKSW